MDITCILFFHSCWNSHVAFLCPLWKIGGECHMFCICTSVFLKTYCVVCSVYLMIHLFDKTFSKLSTESCSNREKFQIDFHIKSLRLLVVQPYFFTHIIKWHDCYTCSVYSYQVDINFHLIKSQMLSFIIRLCFTQYPMMKRYSDCPSKWRQEWVRVLPSL